MRKLVVIGNGMAGVACVEQLLKYGGEVAITIFGDETHVNYNRIMLSSVLAGDKPEEAIVLNDLDWYRKHNIDLKLGRRVVEIDRELRLVRADDGTVVGYDQLIIATGSVAFVPPMGGTDQENVYAFRTLDDTRALLRRARPGARAVVIGGGLLGLEAARGLQVQGCDVTVVHLLETLMNIQLDVTGGEYLRRKIEQLGVKVLTSRKTAALTGDGRVRGVRFDDGEEVPADFVVLACGIRPNTALARSAGLQVNRGIVVDDFLRTSDEHIYAVGECAEHRGIVYGLVAPLLEQGKVLAAALAAEDYSRPYQGSLTAAKLKIMGVDVFSAGDVNGNDPSNEVVRYEDAGQGVYKKLVLKEKRLAGVLLVGDASQEHRFMDWLRTQADLAPVRDSLMFPPPTPDRGSQVAAMADSEIVCGCMGVTKGAIIGAIHEKGLSTLAQLKDCTRASTGCGSCTHLCESLLQAVAPGFAREIPEGMCSCLPYPQEKVREFIRGQQLRSVQEVLDIYGNGVGCEICKPALSYMVDVVWCGEHDEDRSARFINDRVHANIQKDGTFSVIPRMRGGVTSVAELRRIADVAEKYRIPMIKVTGSQRIDLLGVKKQDLPAIWAELDMPSGMAYTKGVRMVKTCVGTEFCRFGTQDSTAAGIELEHRLEQLHSPHKVKMGVVGCPRNCAEATVKDIGLVGQEGGWQVVVGGAAGKTVRKADLLITVTETEQALQAAQIFFQYYRENANYLERTYDFVERLGIEKIRKETVYAPEAVRSGLLERLRKSRAHASDPWLEGRQPARPTQFVQIEPVEVVQ